MKDFNYYTPTEVIFGKESEDKIAALVKKYGGKRVLLHYGGKSAERSGLLGKVEKILADNGIEYVKFGGVQANPRLSMVYEGIELVKTNGTDFILAIGGGSVIDSAKAIACGAVSDFDVWDLFIGKALVENTLPVGVVLTLPAAGSEMSTGCVITNETTGQKRAFDSDLVRPKFAVMNPERTYTLPPYQTACGATDIMMHTMERYFSLEDDMMLTDAIAEGLMRTVKDVTPKVLAAPDDYVLRSQIMWAGSLAHNGLTGCGTVGDWATHLLEHELSGLLDVAHGAGLAAIWPHWAEYVIDVNPKRFAQFAVNVMGVEPVVGDEKATGLRGIEAMKNFYHAIGMPTNIPELIGRPVTDEEIEAMAEKATLGRTITQGNFKVLDYDAIKEVYRMANRQD